MHALHNSYQLYQEILTARSDLRYAENIFNLPACSSCVDIAENILFLDAMHFYHILNELLWLLDVSMFSPCLTEYFLNVYFIYLSYYTLDFQWHLPFTFCLLPQQVLLFGKL